MLCHYEGWDIKIEWSAKYLRYIGYVRNATHYFWSIAPDVTNTPDDLLYNIKLRVDEINEDAAFIEWKKDIHLPPIERKGA